MLLQKSVVILLTLVIPVGHKEIFFFNFSLFLRNKINVNAIISISNNHFACTPLYTILSKKRL